MHGVQNGLSGAGFDSPSVCSSNSNQMTKSNILTILIALFPSYSALFTDGVTSAVILVASTIIGGIFTGVNEGEKDLKDTIQISWILHIVGVFIVIGLKSIQ